MRLADISVKNLRSIVDISEVPLKGLFTLVGENNAGKSNILKALDALLSGGAGGIRREDFFDKSLPIVIRGTFVDLTNSERQRWKKYLVANQLILEKHIWVEDAASSAGFRIKSEYHGYESEPKDWFLSITAIVEQKGQRPKWADIAKENGLPEDFYPDGKSNKAIYTSALERYLKENEVEFNEPDMSATQALGLQSNVTTSLPSFYLLPAITDYSDEIDKRQSSSTFRRLMGELSERILKNDPRFQEIEDALERVHSLLNALGEPGRGKRLEALGAIEGQISALLQQLMPSVSGVSLSVAVEEVKDLFSSGVALAVNDGVETDVLAKGHGLQRCIVFSLLKTLIETERSKYEEATPIILAIEEPELYIHPQLAKLFFDVMLAFSETDQVVYTTHSPIFIDAYRYSNIGIVSKPSVAVGTQIKTCDDSSLDDLAEAKVFRGLARFNPAVNELFFARKILIVEGPEDLIAVNAVLQDAGKIAVRTEEVGWSLLVAGGKPAIPFFQRIANAFEIPYAVLHDVDIVDGMDNNDKATQERQNALIQDLSGDKPVYQFPIKLEASLGYNGHLKDQYMAHKYFSESANITMEVKDIVLDIFQ